MFNERCRATVVVFNLSACSAVSIQASAERKWKSKLSLSLQPRLLLLATDVSLMLFPRPMSHSPPSNARF